VDITTGRSGGPRGIYQQTELILADRSHSGIFIPHNQAKESQVSFSENESKGGQQSFKSRILINMSDIYGNRINPVGDGWFISQEQTATLPAVCSASCPPSVPVR